MNYHDHEVLLQEMAFFRPFLWWAFMRPIAIQRLVVEIQVGVREYIEHQEVLWARFPTEMDILDRNRLAARGQNRFISAPGRNRGCVEGRSPRLGR